MNNMTRKNKGWPREPIRHGLSSKGIETTSKGGYNTFEEQRERKYDTPYREDDRLDYRDISVSLENYNLSPNDMNYLENLLDDDLTIGNSDERGGIETFITPRGGAGPMLVVGYNDAVYDENLEKFWRRLSEKKKKAQEDDRRKVSSVLRRLKEKSKYIITI